MSKFYWSLSEEEMAADRKDFDALPEHVKQFCASLIAKQSEMEDFERRLFAGVPSEKLPQVRALNPHIKLSS